MKEPNLKVNVCRLQLSKTFSYSESRHRSLMCNKPAKSQSRVRTGEEKKKNYLKPFRRHKSWFGFNIMKTEFLLQPLLLLTPHRFDFLVTQIFRLAPARETFYIFFRRSLSHETKGMKESKAEKNVRAFHLHFWRK